MGKFDITAAFQAAVGNVSKSDTDRETIEYIGLDLIDDDPANFYRVDGLEELAANIELCGLQQPIRLRPAEGGRYVIVSGHRRRAALALLAKDAPERWGKAPCIVERDETCPELRELRLILANSSTRVLSPAEVSKQAQRVELLLYQLKEQGYQFPGRMRDQVAAACQVSAPKLARLKVIRERLIPAYLERFDRNELPEQTAYALARMEPELQGRLSILASMLPAVPSGDRAEELLELSKGGVDWRPKFDCPDGSPCKRGDAFLRHDVDCFYGGLCKGETCCLRCPKGTARDYACDRACSKAKAVRKEARDRDQANAAKAEARVQGERKLDVRNRAARLAAAADAAGLADDVQLHVSDYAMPLEVGTLRAWAKGEFGSTILYGSELTARQISDPARLARELGCSTDYLLGVTDQLIPAADTEPEPDGPWHWWPEQPKASGLCWCISGPLKSGGGLYWWNAENEQWEHPAMAFRMTPDVRLWMQCPTLPESMAWERQEAPDGEASL